MATWSRGLRVLPEISSIVQIEQYGRYGASPRSRRSQPITPSAWTKKPAWVTPKLLWNREVLSITRCCTGIPVCFDAKECSVDTFPLSNIHPHQVEFMNAFEQQGGIAFFLIFFSHADLFYYLPLRDLIIFWNRMKEGGRKSFRREELNNSYYLQKKNGF